MLPQTQQFGQTPDVIGDSSFHRWGHTDRGVYPHHVVVRKVQRHSRSQVFQLTGKSIRQPGQPAKLESHREILTLHEAGRDMRGIGISLSDLGYNLRDPWWGVPFIAELPIVTAALSVGQNQRQPQSFPQPLCGRKYRRPWSIGFSRPSCCKGRR